MSDNDGIVNPGGLAMAGIGPVFLAFVPVTSWLAQPDGLLEKLVNGLLSTTTYVFTAGSSSAVAPAATIPALSAIYIAFTYAFTGAASAAGQAAGQREGRDNNHPRAALGTLRGLPLRLYSAHSNLIEMFPGFALAAALSQALAPNDRTIRNLLGLHVLSKVLIFYPSYLLNVGGTRSLAHLLATSSVINVAWRLSRGA